MEDLTEALGKCIKSLAQNAVQRLKSPSNQMGLDQCIAKNATEINDPTDTNVKTSLMLRIIIFYDNFLWFI